MFCYYLISVELLALRGRDTWVHAAYLVSFNSSCGDLEGGGGRGVLGAHGREYIDKLCEFTFFYCLNIRIIIALQPDTVAALWPLCGNSNVSTRYLFYQTENRNRKICLFSLALKWSPGDLQIFCCRSNLIITK